MLPSSERIRRWDALLPILDATADELGEDEAWDEVLQNLGVGIDKAQGTAR